MPKDTLTFNGLTLTRGSDSGGGKARFFHDEKQTVTIDGQTFTVYSKVAAYAEGSEVKKVAPAAETKRQEETKAYDSAKRKTRTAKESAGVATSDGGKGGKTELEVLKEQMQAMMAQLAGLGVKGA